MKKEIETLNKLYELFNKVCGQAEVWNDQMQTDLVKDPDTVKVMGEDVIKFKGEGKKLGKDLKK